MSLLTSFNGRISRKSFWFGLLIILIGAVLISLVILPLVGLGGLFTRVFLFLLSFLILYPMAAIIIKRLHDRGKAAVPWAVIFLAPGVISNALKVFEIGFTTVELAGQAVQVPGTIGYITMLVTTIVGLWMLVELGCLRGDVNSNQYGENPLSKDVQEVTR